MSSQAQEGANLTVGLLNLISLQYKVQYVPLYAEVHGVNTYVWWLGGFSPSYMLSASECQLYATVGQGSLLHVLCVACAGAVVVEYCAHSTEPGPIQ